MYTVKQFLKSSPLIIAFVLMILIAPISAFAAQVVDINRADAATMIENWKGIGEKKARAIVSYRKSNGPFSSIDDLGNVKGIGEGIIKNNRKYMSVSKGVSKPTGKKQSSTKETTAIDSKASSKDKKKKSSTDKKTKTTDSSSAKKSSSKKSDTKSDSKKSTEKKSTKKKSSTKKSSSKSSKKKCKKDSKDKDCVALKKKSKKKKSTT